MTPGVYIEEKNPVPGSAVAVETAVPVFIGYTEKAMRNGKSLVGIPTAIEVHSRNMRRVSGGARSFAKFTVSLVPVAAPAVSVAPNDVQAKTADVEVKGDPAAKDVTEKAADVEVKDDPAAKDVTEKATDGGEQPKAADAQVKASVPPDGGATVSADDIVTIKGRDYTITLNANSTAYFYN